MDLKIITKKKTDHKPWEFWGAFEEEWPSFKGTEVKLSLLLEKAGLDYEAFSEVLDNPGKTVEVTLGTCNICLATAGTPRQAAISPTSSRFEPSRLRIRSHPASIPF